MIKFKISKIFYIILILAVNAISQNFYDINTINTVELIFSQSNWDYLLDQKVAERNDERLLATAIVNGVTFDSVGVRYKGNSSYSANRIKNPFNIKLDYTIDDQEYENYGTIKLSNCYKDPSFIREVLSYEIAREYMPASLANFTKVYVNGEYIGLYTSVQDVDKHFLNSNYNSNDNPFFKGELANSQPNTVTKAWGYFGTDSTGYHNYYELESDQGWSELINFLNVLNNSTDNVNEVLNIDRHLWMLAYDILMVNLDAPVNFAHNYYLYQDNAGRFNPIIWDLNENFGVFSRLLDGPPLSDYGMKQMDPFLNSNNSNYPIVSKILSNLDYKKIYVAHMKTIIEDYFSNGLYRTRAIEIQDIIDTEVQNDPNKLYTYNNFLDNIDNSIGGGGQGPQNQSIIGITNLMDDRVTYLNSLTEFQAVNPTITNVEHNPLQVKPNSTISITSNIVDADYVMLAYRNRLAGVFKKTEMFDDGFHNDGVSGDGIYGIDVSVTSGEFQYYIFAENSDAVSLSPARAEYEFYSLSTVGDIVINEFMADNEKTISDVNDEYNDWIELYNNSDESISLHEYYLSDDSDDLTKWSFPDTSILAKSFIVVWADKDEDQEGLHASFKLSSSGEGIYLSDSDQIIDEVIFSSQESDISTGRYPNGTGDFVQMSPSFGIINQSGSTAIEDDVYSQTPSQFSLEQNYPNPFNPTTTISFSLPETDKITLTIYNSLGQKVVVLVNDNYSAGNYNLKWDASDFASGIYIYTLQSSNGFLTRKMILLK